MTLPSFPLYPALMSWVFCTRTSRRLQIAMISKQSIVRLSIIMWKMQLLQRLRGLRIAVSKTIPQPYLLEITRNHFQGNPFQTVFFHSLSSNNKGFLHTRQFPCLLTRIAAIGMPQFTLKSWNDVLNTSVSSLLNSGDRSSKLAVSTTNMESSSPLVSENFLFFNWSSLSGFSRHTNILMTETNDNMLTNLTQTKLITWNRRKNWE